MNLIDKYNLNTIIIHPGDIAIIYGVTKKELNDAGLYNILKYSNYNAVIMEGDITFRDIESKYKIKLLYDGYISVALSHPNIKIRKAFNCEFNRQI